MQNSAGASSAQFIKMTQTPIPKLIVTLAVPTVASMLVSSIYNLADTFFVGQLKSNSATGAVGVVFSLMAILQAFGFMVGMGSGSVISRLLGRQEGQKASHIASMGFFTSLGCGALLGIGGLIFLEPLMRLLGATDTILPYACDYGRYILAAAPLMCASFTMNNMLRYEGKAAFAMIGLTTGGILNILLDPLFIFVFDMGIAGAALATALSQCVSFCLLLAMFLVGKSQLRLSVRLIGRDLPGLKNILACGLPSFARQALASVATALLNWQAGQCGGDAAVAAMSVVGRIFMFVFAVMLGIGQGFQPVAGYNYGAGKFNRLRQAFRFTLLLGEGCICVVALGTSLAAPWLIQAFRNDPQVIEIGVFACRLQCCAMLLVPLGTCANMLFQSTGQSTSATFLSSLRQGLYYLPLMLVLPLVIGLRGVQIAQPLADVLTFITSVPFLVRFFAQLPRQDRE